MIPSITVQRKSRKIPNTIQVDTNPRLVPKITNVVKAHIATAVAAAVIKTRITAIQNRPQKTKRQAMTESQSITVQVQGRPPVTDTNLVQGRPPVTVTNLVQGRRPATVTSPVLLITKVRTEINQTEVNRPVNTISHVTKRLTIKHRLKQRLNRNLIRLNETANIPVNTQ